MTVRTITEAGRSYVIRPEPRPATGNRSRAILSARLEDELTGEGLVGTVEIASPTAGLVPRRAGNGVVGLVGNPARRFPDLAAQPADIEITLASHRYLPRRATVTLGPINTGLGAPADFPDHFAPVDLGTLAMHRAPTRIGGRTLQSDGSDRVPVPNAEVRLAGIWRRAPGPDDDPLLLIEPPDILALSPGLYRARQAGGDTLRDRAPVLAPQRKRITLSAEAGATEIRLSDRVGLNVGDLLAIAPDDPHTAEFIRITAVDGTSAPTEPAVVTLGYPLGLTHLIGQEAAPAVPGPVFGAGDGFLRDAIPGDRTAHLDGLAGSIPDLGVVEISGAGLPEYQTARRYRAVSDAEGDYRLPPLSRVARVRVETVAAGLIAPSPADIGPDYDRPETRLDFVYPP